MQLRSLFPLAVALPVALFGFDVQPVATSQQDIARPAALVPQSAARYIAPKYGPFRVNGDRLELVRETDSMSARWLAQALSDHPGLVQLDMIECPGTIDDIANLQLGRMIRDAGLRTHVPSYGSVRSGAVELFLAGVERTMENGAEFAVHSWRDEYGHEADDPTFPGYRSNLYLDYYTDMGMSSREARAFYAMTNSALHLRVLWMDAKEMSQWVDRYP